MRTQRLRPLLVVLAAGTLLASQAGTPAHADPRADRARVDADLQRTGAALEDATERAQLAVQAYGQAVAALPAARVAAADARGLAAAAAVAAAQGQREAAAQGQRYQAAEAVSADADARLDTARDDVGHFVASAYRGAGAAAVNAVLTATTPGDLAQRLSWLDQVAQRRQRAVVTFTGARLAAGARRDAAAAAWQGAQRAATARLRAFAEAQTGKAAADLALAQVNDLVARAAKARADADAQRGAVLAHYAQLRRESARIERELRDEAAHQSGQAGGVALPGPGTRGYLRTPVDGTRSSNFGMRFDPYYRVWQLHAGVDLAAGNGQPIRAAAAGRVLRAGWNGGYGNYTCLLHGRYRGRSLATCYGHQSQILVRAGQQVAAGTVIGRVGTTGASTGYHLHFEVRLDGRPVDPVGWLPACLC